MPSQFKIGTDTSSNFFTLDDLLDEPYPGDPDWSYQPYSSSVRLASGKLQGNGFPLAKWRWNAMSDSDRTLLKAYVGANLSAPVYIQTAINTATGETIDFDVFSAVMNWPDTDEDFQASKVIGLIIVFSHLVPV